MNRLLGYPVSRAVYREIKHLQMMKAIPKILKKSSLLLHNFLGFGKPYYPSFCQTAPLGPFDFRRFNFEKFSLAFRSDKYFYQPKISRRSI